MHGWLFGHLCLAPSFFILIPDDKISFIGFPLSRVPSFAISNAIAPKLNIAENRRIIAALTCRIET